MTSRTPPFHALTHRGQLRRLRRAARLALPAWGLAGARLVTLDLVENATFRVEADARFLLRIQLPRFKAPGEIRSEFAWLDALHRDTGLEVPRAVPAADGERVVGIDTGGDPPQVFASLLEWIPGRIHGRRAGPARHRALGALMARLHAHAASWRPPRGFRRYDWRGRGLFGEGNDFVLDRAGIDASIPAPHRGYLRDLEARTREAMAEMDRDARATGLIHADLHPANIVFQGARACPIDFEDCGTGYWIYDLAVPAAWAAHDPGQEALVDALVEGYESVRPFPAGQLRYLRLFRAVRHASNALWVADHARDLAHCRDGLSRSIAMLVERARRAEAG